MSNPTTEAKALLAELNALDLSNPNSHADAVFKAQSLVHTLKSPGDKCIETMFSSITTPCLFTMYDLGVFEKLSHQGTLTAAQLSQQTGADALLIARLMRILTAHDVATEVGPQTYAPNAVTHLYATPAWSAGFRFTSKSFGSVNRLPEYLKQINYRHPDSRVEPGPFQYCMGTDLPTFGWLAKNPDIGTDFNLFMTSRRLLGHWSEDFPVQERLFNGSNGAIKFDAPLVVDVAGGYGHDLRLVKDKLAPVHKGRFVLEDQASVIETVPNDLYDANIEYVKHDFFAPQPVKGARVYTLKSIIHDWPDDDALKILRNIAAAMEPGYSKLWIIDGIVPETNAPKPLIGLDITMMLFLRALERTEKQWHALLDQAGLAIAHVQKRSDGFGVIEAVLSV